MEEQIPTVVLEVRKVLTAPIFLNLGNFGTKRDTKQRL